MTLANLVAWSSISLAAAVTTVSASRHTQSSDPVPAPTAQIIGGSALHVDSIVVGYSNVGGPNRQPHAYVYVKDAFGVPVNGAIVSGNWTGCTIQSGVTATTAPAYNSSGAIVGNGRAHFVGKKKACWGNNGCDFVFTVTGIAMPGSAYDSAANVETTELAQCQ